jgi:hypothetical protein
VAICSVQFHQARASSLDADGLLRLTKTNMPSASKGDHGVKGEVIWGDLGRFRSFGALTRMYPVIFDPVLDRGGALAVYDRQEVL